MAEQKTSVREDHNVPETARAPALAPAGLSVPELPLARYELVFRAAEPVWLPPLAGPMLSVIDGRTDLAALHRTVAGLQGGRLPWDAFKRQFDRLYATLNGLNKMYLSL